MHQQLLNSLSIPYSTKDKITTGIFDLGNNENEEKRSQILKNLVTKENILEILEGIDKLDRRTVLENICVSGAGMIKFKLFETENGQVRYHIFSDEVGKLDGIDFDENPHMHDFQAISHVLLGELGEERFRVSQLNVQEFSIYQKLQEKWALLNPFERKKFLKKFIAKNGEINIEGITYISEYLSKFYTVFDSNKRKIENESLIEEFYSIGQWKFEKFSERTTSQGHSYFLDSHIAHRALENSDDTTSTMFITDTTYASKGFPKQNNVFLRGHGVQFADQQELKIFRSNKTNAVTMNEITNILQKTTKKILTS